jgi:dipeptidyl aminopeptidase/acylaminoacyl peptidase
LRSLQRIWIVPALLVLVLPSVELCAGQRTFTVRDSIEMTNLSDPNILEQDGQAKFSPDGRHFLVVTTRGIVQSDQLESCLMIFDTSSIRFATHEAPQLRQLPKCVARLAAVPHAQQGTIYPSIISDARWSSDSKSIYFLGQGLRAERHLYSVNLSSGKPRQLTPLGYDVTLFDCARQVVVYIASRTSFRTSHSSHDYGEPVNPDARSVTGIGLTDLLFPQSSRESERSWQVWAVDGNRHPTMISAIAKPLSGNTDIAHEVLSISPDGSEVVILIPVKRISQQWDNYEAGLGYESWRIHAKNAESSTSGYPLKQYALIDLHKKRVIPLIDAPIGTALGYFDRLKTVWSKDGRHLLLTNTFMPIGGAGMEGEDHPLRPCTIASIELVSRTARCIVAARRQDLEASDSRGAWQLQDVSFGADVREVLATFDPPQQKRLIERYQENAKGWLGPSNVSGPPTSNKNSQKVEVHVRQGLNDPPTLWATEVATGKQTQVLDPNPGLKEIDYGEASLYHWKDSSGYEWSGILVKPVGYTKGERYPLVIQTHGFRDNAFVTDGIFPTAMAARPLASTGIAVLQTEYRHDVQGSAREAEVEAEKFESAVRRLASDGLIDPTRVGIIGFSYTCWQVESTLINRPTLFRVATIADGIDNSYMQYHLFGEGIQAFAAQFEKANGGKPLGIEGVKSWLSLAPGFRLNEVQAPLRIEALGAPSILGEWEIYSSLRLQGKPVDLIYIPNGAHVLQKPLERMASQQGNVDWFRFWLQDYQDPDPQKTQQYQRWNSLKELRDANAKAENKAVPTTEATPTKPN